MTEPFSICPSQLRGRERRVWEEEAMDDSCDTLGQVTNRAMEGDCISYEKHLR